MAKFESSIRRARRASLLLAASACLQWAATPAQAQEGLCGLVPAGGIDDIAGVIVNIVGSPEFFFPVIPSLSQDLEAPYLAQMSQEWGPFPLGSGPFCSKTAQNFVKVCRTVVTSSVGCLAHQIDALAKQDKEGCKAFAGSEAKACEAAVATAADAYLARLALAQNQEVTKCTVETGNHFFRKCLLNAP
jgi:hypothetical protein